MASSMEVKGNIFRIILLPILGIVLFCSNTGAEEQIHSLGISLLASEIENKYPVSALSDFIVHGGFTPVVIDWAWITYHWEKTDFEGVNRLLRILKEHNVKFAAMYRPRFLSVPTVPYQIKKDGSPAFSHGFEIRFTSPEARRWGWQWGLRILEKCPAFNEVIIYNPRNVDQSPEAIAERRVDPYAHYSATWTFLQEAKDAWRATNPAVRLGVVYMPDLEFWKRGVDILDVARPFLYVKEDVDMEENVADVLLLRPILGRKLKASCAKITWGETDKVSPRKLATFNRLTRKNEISYFLWIFDTPFLSSLYDPHAASAALGLKYSDLEGSLRMMANRQKRSRTQLPTGGATKVNQARDWVYFESRESFEGQPPVLRLSYELGDQDIPVSEDTVLISYLPQRIWGNLRRLSVSMNDTNRVLMKISLLPIEHNPSKAELILDMKQSGNPTVAPFDLAVYVVTEPWLERTVTWENQPAFAPDPCVVVSIDPEPGIKRIDITEIVNRWFAGKVPNHGLLLKVEKAFPAVPTAVVPNIAFPAEEPVLESLPWPHQSPSLSSRGVKTSINDLWIINDFPLYQGNEDGSWRYFHGGLDIVVNNGTPIYAMKDGWVRSVSNTTITIADTSGEEPAYGWEYTHLGNSLVQVGQFVTRGTKIGEVDFHGTAHIHLTKVFSQGQYWGQWRYVCMPNGHFTYLDEEPPVIGDSFYFFENNSNTEIKPNQRGDIVVRGQVDIVVPMREQGLYARSNDNGFGDRLGITRIEYEIRPKGTAPNSGKQFKSFDFKNIKIKKSTNNKAYNTELTKVVYKHWTLLERERSSWNRVFSYYTITNCTGDRSPRELFVTDRDFCWDTSALDQTGNSVFPNGIYDIMVTAYDYFGNHTTRTVSVRVHNLAEGPH